MWICEYVCVYIFVRCSAMNWHPRVYFFIMLSVSRIGSMSTASLPELNNWVQAWIDHSIVWRIWNEQVGVLTAFLSCDWCQIGWSGVINIKMLMKTSKWRDVAIWGLRSIRADAEIIRQIQRNGRRLWCSLPNYGCAVNKTHPYYSIQYTQLGYPPPPFQNNVF